MFEAVIAICALAGEPCDIALLPGHEAGDRATCEAGLDSLVRPEWPGAETRDAPFCREIGQALEFQEVLPGLFVHEGKTAEWEKSNGGDVANIAFVVGARSVAVIDSGSGRHFGEAVWRAVRGVTMLPVSHVIVTHMHPDHALGATVLAAGGAEVVGHPSLDRALADRIGSYLDRLTSELGPKAALGTGPAKVTIPVEDHTSIDLGDRVLMLRSWPTSHTGTDVTVLDRETGTLIAGDLVFDSHTPALDGSLRGWQSVMDDLLSMDVKHVVPGHGAALLDWPAGGTAQQTYLDILARDTEDAIAEGQRLGDAIDTVAAAQADVWELFEAFNPRNATVAFTELEWE